MSVLEVFGGTTAQFLRMSVDVEVGLGMNILDLLDAWLEFPVLEDRRGVAGRELRVMIDGASAAAWGVRASYKAIHHASCINPWRALVTLSRL